MDLLLSRVLFHIPLALRDPIRKGMILLSNFKDTGHLVRCLFRYSVMSEGLIAK